DFGWGHGAPARVPTDFAARFAGTIAVERAGRYRFRTASDDGVRLWVGDELVIDDWTVHGTVTRSGTVELTPGHHVPVVLEYFDGGGRAEARLGWSHAGAACEIVPSSSLRVDEPAPPGAGVDAGGCAVGGG